MQEPAPRLMVPTPGFTPKKFAKLPIASEGEATPGPDSVNPFRSEQERREIEEILQMREERKAKEVREGDGMLRTVPSERPFISFGETEGPELPPLMAKGPQF